MNAAGFAMRPRAGRMTARRSRCADAGQAGRQGDPGREDADEAQIRLLAALVGPDAAASVVAARGRQEDERGAGGRGGTRPIHLEGKIVTADALHTVKATADRIHEHGGELRRGEGEPPRFVRRPRRAAVGPGSGRSYRHRQGPRPDHHPDHPGPARSRRPAVPARQPGVPHRSGTLLALAASRSRQSPRSASRARKPARQAPPTWPATSASNGRSSPCTGSATPSTKRTDPSAWQMSNIMLTAMIRDASKKLRKQLLFTRETARS